MTVARGEGAKRQSEEKATRIRTATRLVAGACLALGATAALAGDISSIQPGASSVTLQGGKAVVNFSVGGTAASNES